MALTAQEHLHIGQAVQAGPIIQTEKPSTLTETCFCCDRLDLALEELVLSRRPDAEPPPAAAAAARTTPKAAPAAADLQMLQLMLQQQQGQLHPGAGRAGGHQQRSMQQHCRQHLLPRQVHQQAQQHPLSNCKPAKTELQPQQQLHTMHKPQHH